MRRQFLQSALALSLAAATGASLAQELTPVTIGWGAYPDVPQIAQAADKKLWAAEKIDAKIIPFASGRAGFEALIGGQVDYAVMAEFPAVSGVMRGLKFSIVGVLSQYKAFRVIAKSDKPVDLKSLAGKKVAVPVGTNVHFIVAEAMEKLGVKAELVNVPPPEMAVALARGDVDAIMTFPSGYGNAKKVLGAQYQEINLPEYASSFVLAALIKGEEFIGKNASESQEVTARFVGGATTVDAVRTAWPEYEFRIKLDASTLDLMVREGKWLKANGLVKEGEPSTALYRRAFAPEVLRSLDTKRVSLPN